MNPSFVAYCLATAAVPLVGAVASRRYWRADSSQFRRVWWWLTVVAGLLAAPTLLAVVLYGTLVGVVWLSGVETEGGLAHMGGPPFFMQSVIYSAFVGCPASLVVSGMLLGSPTSFASHWRKRLRVLSGIVLAMVLVGVLFWR